MVLTHYLLHMTMRVIVGAVLVAALFACGSARAVAPGTRAVPLAPDTAALALVPIAAPSLLTLVDEATVTDSAALRYLGIIRARPTSHTVRTGLANDGIDELLSVDGLVAIDVNATRRLVFRGTRRTVSTQGYVTWEGTLQGGVSGFVTLTLLAPYNLRANITVLGVPSYTYSVASLSGRVLSVTYIDPSKYLPD